MPLREETIVEKRLEAVLMVRSGLSISETARHYRVTRPTLYEWIRRYDANEGLADRSRAPHSCPHRTEEWIAERLIEERSRWKFGSKKILQRLHEDEPSIAWPSRATADVIFKRAGMVQRRRRRARTYAPISRPQRPVNAPGDLTTVDFKGEFRLRNGKYCYPLTIADSFSRYLLACEALSSTELRSTWKVLERVFRDHGLPRAVQSDNGVPFGAHGHGRFSTLSVRLMRLGIEPIFSRPGKPQDNAAHERMHKTLKEYVQAPSASLAHQQLAFDAFRNIFNHERPHEGIGMQRPVRLYRSSPRPFPEIAPKLEYEAWFETRLVHGNGMISWRNRSIYIGQPFAAHRLGFEPVDYALWNVHFATFVIGVLDENKGLFL